MAKTPAQRAAKHGESATPPQTPVVNTSTQRSPQKAQGNANLILIAGSAASLLLFWYFHMLTLQQLTDLSDGLAMPQSMVFGFDMAHVEALRSAMDADALGQLNYVQKTAGTLFALVFAFSAMTMIAMNVAKKAVRWVLWAFPILFAGISLWGNASIDAMLGAETLSAGAVTLPSTLVSLSWLLLALTLLSIAVALFLSRRKKPAPTQS
ncbi:hypothetical protein CVS30_05005 [Arthrobacter psychrolactophilus]|uniref:Uncharacterized protein n=1 Tax=Arthrobacter psychrolactophilus TaxID=92442 RepID=A0A2V5JMI9_9MICC|nr:hypothetical protein [Arthrobacter psychrolactophilus]PYI39326.1 hypothetical protein CVS30_05005 [Arthrobacter psychrolactophilus]